MSLTEAAFSQGVYCIASAHIGTNWDGSYFARIWGVSPTSGVNAKDLEALKRSIQNSYQGMNLGNPHTLENKYYFELMNTDL